MNKNRREFLKFLGVSSVGLSQLSSLSLLGSCSHQKKALSSRRLPSFKDDLILREGLHYYPLISWGDSINQHEAFGFNNDYITYKPLSPDELIMWVNHEYTNPLFVSGRERSKENIDKERRSVGGSIIKVKKENQKWRFQAGDPHNRGVRGDTPIKFAYDKEIMGAKIVEGTCSNCAGGFTPWGTFLSCEENPHKNYGEKNRHTGDFRPSSQWSQWEKFYPHPIEHYSWVVEIEPVTGAAQKHINLGRFGHESATCTVSNNQVVVYSGDDKEDEHLYKFVSQNDKDFKQGTLYVANLEQGKWLPLDLEKSPELKKHFKNQIEVLTYCREASKIVGATPLNRPEDIEVHPHNGDVYVTLTRSDKRHDPFGSILKVSEKNADHTSLNFTHETFVMGGEASQFACPDNLAFDQNGHLWMATDMSDKDIGQSPYKSFGNNGLFVIPTSGAAAGEVIQVASCPVDAEFTGLCFSPDQKSLFVSVQHPGEGTRNIHQPTSTWPTGSTPKPTVVVIEGEFLESLTQKRV